MYLVSQACRSCCARLAMQNGVIGCYHDRKRAIAGIQVPGTTI